MGTGGRASQRLVRALQGLQPGDETDEQQEAILRQLRQEIEALPPAELNRLWCAVQQGRSKGRAAMPQPRRIA